MTMKCQALETGYDGLCVREPGAEFDLPDGSEPAPWFKVLSGGEKGKKGKNTPEAQSADNGQSA